MLNLIDYTYFQNGRVNIPNIGTPPVSTGLQAEIDAYVTQYQKQYLIELLGEDLYNAFAAAWVTPLPTSGRWFNLAAQIRNTTTKLSPLAEYVYFYYWREHQQYTTASGDKQFTGANMIQAANTNKAVGCWNHMVDTSAEIYDWLTTNKATYPEWQGAYPDVEMINEFGI